MSTLDDIIAGENAVALLNTMKADPALAGIDTSTSFIHDALSPTATLIAQENQILEHVAESATVVGVPGHRAVGLEIDRHVALLGLARKNPISATVILRFTGNSGASIPAFTTVSTAGSNAQAFQTQIANVMPVGGTIDVNAVALAPGTAGNVPAGTITILSTQLTGVSTVTNPFSATGGVDTETDDNLIARFLQDAADMPNGVNPAQYRSWSLQVSGVGAASVLRPGDINGPTAPGPDVYLVDTNFIPVSQAIADAVQAYIAPATSVLQEAELMTIRIGTGVSILSDPNASNGQAIAMTYNAVADGLLVWQTLNTYINEAGVWAIRPFINASRVDQTTPLIQIGVWNVTNTAWATTRPSGTQQALITYTGAQLSTGYTQLPQLEFFWNGNDVLELRIERLSTDTLTTVNVDYVIARSTFSSSFLEGKATVGHRVTVRPAVAVPINVAASVKAAPNQSNANVLTTITQAITGYLQTIALNTTNDLANDVIYGMIGSAIANAGSLIAPVPAGQAPYTSLTPTISYYDPSTLKVNGGINNITVQKNEVATIGTITLTFL